MKKVTIPQNDIVEALVPDPGNVQTYQMLSGWIGKSTRKGHVRLYDELDMAAYFEFAEEDVCHIQSTESSDNPMGGSVVWLAQDAKVISIGQRSGEMDDRAFLQGDFAQAMAGYDFDRVKEPGGNMGDMRGPVSRNYPSFCWYCSIFCPRSTKRPCKPTCPLPLTAI